MDYPQTPEDVAASIPDPLDDSGDVWQRPNPNANGYVCPECGDLVHIDMTGGVDYMGNVVAADGDTWHCNTCQCTGHMEVDGDGAFLVVHIQQEPNHE